jgi:two-component system NtrC family sensor kinase
VGVEQRQDLDGDVDRAERRVAARGRELEALQALGRRAAEAHAPESLFDSVLAALHRVDELDLAIVAHALQGRPTLRLRTSRPFDEGYVEQLVERARRFLGWPPTLGVTLERSRLHGYDEARGVRDTFREEDLVLLPLLRGGQPVACLLAVPAAGTDEGRLRLLYGASNLLTLHLERILHAREAEAHRFGAIVEAMPQGVLLLDDRWRVVQANRAAHEMLAACGLGQCVELGPALERLALAPLIARVGNGTAALAEGEVRPQGDHHWSVTVSRLPGDDPGLVLVLSDVTDRRRMEQQLAQAEKMSSLGQLISGVAHELNNPLAAIVGYAQLIRGGEECDEKLRARLELLGREAERCRKIVHNLLSFVRRREPERKPLALNEVVDSVVALLEYQLRVDGIRVERELDRSLPRLEGDAHQLEQVLVNLLTNAAQAMRATGKPGRVTVRTLSAPPDFVLLEISDTGPGIAEADRTRIFDPFFTTKGPGEGTGLGLSLACGIVSAHGGSIEALPHEGPGCTFRIRLPAGRGVAPPAREAAKPAVPPPPVRAGRVLVVDDDEGVARLLCDALAKDGLTVDRARDGGEALAAVAARPYDLIVCDVKMPDMNGERFYDELCRVHPTLARTLVWTTGDTLGPEPERLVRRTGLDLLPKPFDLDELRDRVRRRLGRPD